MTVSLLVYLFALLATALGVLAAALFLRNLQLPKAHRQGQVTLILPLTGECPGLESLLRALDTQTLRPRRLFICVEDSPDPAWSRATALAGSCGFPIEVVVVDPASRCAQKCANQIAALRRVDAQDEAVVLLDGDIVPPDWWLSALSTPLLDGSADIVGGYRWPVVQPGHAASWPAAHMIAAIDRAVALFPRRGAWEVLWGGSMAFSPRALAALQPERILATTLSDDCTIGAQAVALGLRIVLRRALLVPTPVRGGLWSVWRFGLRQYQMVRIYRPGKWRLAACVLSTRLAAWGVLFANIELAMAQLGLALLLGTALAGSLIQARVAKRLGFPDSPDVQLGQATFALLKPLVDLFHWSAVMAALDSGTVRWGHIEYRVAGPASVTVSSRTPWA